MIIVVDTSILYSDLRLRGRLKSTLEDAARLAGACVAIPSVVVDEAEAQFRLRLSEELNALQKVCRTFTGDLGIEHGVDLASAEVKCARAADEYKRELRAFLQMAGWELLDYPDSTHEKLVERAISRRRPFREKDRGYRDTLIWLSAVERLVKAAGDDKLLLLSGNVRDFADDDGEIHRDLVVDLEERGLSREQVEFCPSIAALYQRYVEPAQAELASFRERFNAGGLGQEEVIERILDDPQTLDLQMFFDEDLVEAEPVDGPELERIEATHAWRQNGLIALAGAATVVLHVAAVLREVGKRVSRRRTLRCPMMVDFVVLFDATGGLAKIEIGPPTALILSGPDGGDETPEVGDRP